MCLFGAKYAFIKQMSHRILPGQIAFARGDAAVSSLCELLFSGTKSGGRVHAAKQ